MTLPVGDARLVSALDAKMGLEILELTADRVVGRMPVDGNTQPFGLWHGGASCVLAETLASLGSLRARLRQTGSASGSISTPPITGRFGQAGCWARRPHCGWADPVVSYEVVLTDDAGYRVCTARVTCQMVGRVTSAG